MKIQELFEDGYLKTPLSAKLATSTNPTHDELRKAVDTQRQNPKNKFVGAGSFAYVDREEDPHEMDNVRRTSKDTDNTSKYLSMVKDMGMGGNLYLPRVLDVKQSSGVVQHKIERLVPIDDPKMASVELVSGWVIRTLGERGGSDLISQARQSSYDDDEFVETLLYYWADMIDNYLNKFQEPSSDADPAFLKAIAFITSVQKQMPDSISDIHTGNIMWRLTSTGPHLVITDPLFSTSD